VIYSGTEEKRPASLEKRLVGRFGLLRPGKFRPVKISDKKQKALISLGFFFVWSLRGSNP